MPLPSKITRAFEVDSWIDTDEYRTPGTLIVEEDTTTHPSQFRAWLEEEPKWPSALCITRYAELCRGEVVRLRHPEEVDLLVQLRHV